MRSDGAQTVLRTLLISDLADSTFQLGQMGDRSFAALVQLHDRLARDLLQRHGGQEIDKTDGFLLLFERPLSAVLYALDYHEALRALGVDEGCVIEGRVGIHLGEVVLRENPPADVARGAKPIEVEGLAKPTAARLMSLAGGGQTLLTRAAFILARRAAVDAGETTDFRWLAHGAYCFRGVAQPVGVFEVGRVGHAPLSPPADSAKARRATEQPIVTDWRPVPGGDIPHRPHWLVEEKLGEGGFGEVWLARHYKTRDRRVFKFCYDEERLPNLQREITLFRLLKDELGERRDIVRILDWNFERAPYFVESEYTTAGDLPQWLEAQGGCEQVPLATRIEIVAQVATALAAAHSVGILHKDVKPSNVLMHVDLDGQVQARLADFGIGRVVERERLAAAGITALGMAATAEESRGSSAAGTRLYMAPEVLEGKPPTQQADLYALGVVLYQLVVGDLGRSLAPGWRRDVADGLLAQDIACFVDHSPARRPASAREVAERLRNLESRREALTAAETSRLDLKRAQRWRRLATALAVVAVVVLAAVSMFASWAEQMRREEEKARRAAERVADFLEEIFEPGDPQQPELTPREILDRGAAKLQQGELDDEPLIRARLMQTLGSVYQSLGLYDSAELLMRRALALRQQTHGGEHPEVATSLNNLGTVLHARGDYEGAESLVRGALAMRRRLLGGEDAMVAESLRRLGSLLVRKGNYAEAESTYRESLGIYQHLFGAKNSDVALVLNNLGATYLIQGDYAKAEQLFRESIDASSDEGSRLGQRRSNLATVLMGQGDYAGAEPLLREGLEIHRRVFGDDHPEVAGSLRRLGELLHFKGDYAGAEPLLRQALEMHRRLLGDEPSRVARSLTSLGRLLHSKKEYEEAEPMLRQSLEMQRRLHGNDHLLVAASLERLASLLAAQGSAAEGEALVREALAVYARIFPAHNWRSAKAESILGACLIELGRYPEAEDLILGSYPIVRDETGEQSIDARDILERLIRLYEAWGKPGIAAGYRTRLAEATPD